MPGLLYKDDFVLFSELGEYLKMIVGSFEVCRRRGLKVNVDKRKVMVLGREKRLECDVLMDGK